MWLVLLSLAAAVACERDAEPTGSQKLPPDAAGQVSTSRLEAETNVGENWLVKGGRLTGEHFSPLSQINADNVKKLGLAWTANIPSPIGLVAEPIVVDGVIYLSAPFSIVYAIDAATGEELWRFDPEVDPSLSGPASISARFNRGVAVWKGSVIVGTGDCRLVAIDAARGTKRWDVSACDPNNGREVGLGGGAGITGAPLVADDKVFIGYLGSDTNARGSIAAFDVETGKELWRFWTVPGDPNGPDGGLETEALRKAAKTWTGGWAFAGGGAVWDSMHYDPVTGFVIVGTASGMPLSTAERGPGDNLYTNSVIALDGETGAYRWHYQTVPSDAWDYDATMPKIVTDLEIAGKPRRVVFEAGKSGFFYVLDAYTGELLSADAITKVTWASHVDLETGKPVTLPEARYWERDPADFPIVIHPNGYGARNWEPMAFSPKTGLVYMPVSDIGSTWCDSKYYASCAGLDSLGLTADDEVPPDLGRLLAWDPVERKERWSSVHELPFNGGVLATAGDLVFQGTGTGELQAHHARTGQPLWSRRTGSSIQAAPVTYRVGEDQHVLVAVGTGGGLRLIHPTHSTTPDARGPARLIAFKLGGASELPVAKGPEIPMPRPPVRSTSAEQVANGGLLWGACETCHGSHAVALGKMEHGGSIPDLRYSPFLHSGWTDVVDGGVLAAKGMPSMTKLVGLTVEDTLAIRAYVIEQAWKGYEKSAGATE